MPSTPGGKAGFRPDYAVKTYTQILKRLFPAYAGGHRRYRGFIAPPDPLRLLERFAPSSILPADSGADLLIYGMGAGDSTGGAGDVHLIQRQVVAKYPTGGIHGPP